VGKREVVEEAPGVPAVRLPGLEYVVVHDAQSICAYRGREQHVAQRELVLEMCFACQSQFDTNEDDNGQV